MKGRKVEEDRGLICGRCHPADRPCPSKVQAVGIYVPKRQLAEASKPPAPSICLTTFVGQPLALRGQVQFLLQHGSYALGDFRA